MSLAPFLVNKSHSLNPVPLPGHTPSWLMVSHQAGETPPELRQNPPRSTPAGKGMLTGGTWKKTMFIFSSL